MDVLHECYMYCGYIVETMFCKLLDMYNCSCAIWKIEI